MKILALHLTCANNAEADAIAKQLLAKKLIACAKQVPVTAQFVWNNAVEQSDEILLSMETIEKYAQAIEAEIKKLHSYETFVLIGFEAVYVSQDARNWLLQELDR